MADKKKNDEKAKERFVATGNGVKFVKHDKNKKK